MPGKTACCQFCPFTCAVKGGGTANERHSREGACERIGIAGFWKTPQRHSREGGNPFIKLEQAFIQAFIWVPACERVKKSKLQTSARLRNVIPAKAGIHFSRWNKLLYGYPPSRVRRCGRHFNRFGDFFTRSKAGIHLSGWNNILDWSAPSRGRRCGPSRPTAC